MSMANAAFLFSSVAMSWVPLSWGKPMMKSEATAEVGVAGGQPGEVASSAARFLQEHHHIVVEQLRGEVHLGGGPGGRSRDGAE